jgi:hopanoid biosynthesis associated protein HpnK
LIVTADDFGLAPEVNQAVEQAHRNGILSAASLMVGARASPDAVARARRMPSLRVGLHLVLTDGAPILARDRIPDLVNGAGSLRTDMVKAGVDIFLRPSVRRQMRAEIEAQFAAFRETGLQLDHVNSHHHFHLHPTVGAELLRVGVENGMRGVRVPREPRRLLRQIEPGTKTVFDPITVPWAALLQSRVRHRGLRAPDRVFGLTWSGAMTQPRLLGILNNLPEGAIEIYLHPATSNAFPEAKSGYRYADELAALTSPAVMAALRASGAQLSGFADLR